jgi:prepilin-type N-terminal cleavage/methylation domain-containing protein
MSKPANSFVANRGFTLIEMAVVLFIFGLLIAGLLGPVETQLEARDRDQTIDTMNEIVEALYGYALTNGRLPCPDSDGDGFPDMTTEPFSAADSTTADCDGGSDFTNGEGFVPWVELNVTPGDAWSNRFRYRVRWPQFTWPDSDGNCDGDTAPEEFDLCATGDTVVLTRGDNPATSGTIEGKFSASIGNSLPAVLISHGRNGFGAISTSGAARPTTTAGTDEAENTNGDATFYGRIYTGDNSPCADDTDESTALCPFDDIVVWLSPALLNNRMVVAGRLP